MKEYKTIEDCSFDEKVLLNHLVETVKGNAGRQKHMNWYRYTFPKLISYYQIKKLFFIANALDFITVYSFYDDVKKKQYWNCKYNKSIPSEHLDINFQNAVHLKKQELKIQRLHKELLENTTQNLKEIAKKLKISYASAKSYFQVLKKKFNLTLKKTKKDTKDFFVDSCKQIVENVGIIFEKNSFLETLKENLLFALNSKELIEKLTYENKFYKEQFYRSNYENKQNEEKVTDYRNQDMGDAVNRFFVNRHYQNFSF